MPEMHIGQWSSGEPIALINVPLSHELPRVGISAIYFFEASNGGMFSARYDCIGPIANDKFEYRLAAVEEVMPPRPPQIQGYGDDRRLPMMDRWGYSAAREADQRKREWAEVTHGA